MPHGIYDINFVEDHDTNILNLAADKVMEGVKEAEIKDGNEYQNVTSKVTTKASKKAVFMYLETNMLARMDMG